MALIDPRSVLITGFGVRSAFGTGSEPLMANVFNGVPGFRPVTRFDSTSFRTDLAAFTDDTPSQREALIECASAALQMSGLSEAAPGATLVGTAGDFSPITAFWAAANGADDDDRQPGAVQAPLANRLEETLPAMLVDTLARFCGLDGPQLAFTNGCVASSNAIIHGCRLIRAGRQDIAVCGGVYLVEQEFFAKFNAGRAFSRDGRLRPFSAGRSGLLLGDGAAVLVLESAERVARRGGLPLAQISGWGMASDAYHVCKPHPSGLGIAAAADQAVRLAGIDSVDYINAHGTSTELNDKAETAAIKRAFGAGCNIPISSTKASTGHTLEASGALETVLSLLAISNSVIPPTGGYLGRDDECDLDYVTTGPREQPLKNVLSVNAAFGGANSALVLSSV